MSVEHASYKADQEACGLLRLTILVAALVVIAMTYAWIVGPGCGCDTTVFV